MKFIRFFILVVAMPCLVWAAIAGNEKTPVPNPPQALEAVTTATAAKSVFGARKEGSDAPPHAIGTYNRGCLAGAEMLPVDGPAWQAMRLSRNRNWGHPKLIAYLKRLAKTAQSRDGWPGLLVGDLAQPMGGPMVSGHASHQIGLDADIWLNPMPNKTLSHAERENISAKSMLAADKVSVDEKIWTAEHAKLIKRAASYPEVARIFVHPAIKKKLCDMADKDRDWLAKVRPWWGHHYHFHVRLACPASAKLCDGQPPVGSGDGCGKELTYWLHKVRPPKEPVKPSKTPPKARPPLTFADLPSQCTELAGVEIHPDMPMPVRRPPDAKHAAKAEKGAAKR